MSTVAHNSRRSSDSAPGFRQMVKFLTATMMGASLLLLSSLVMTATIIGLVVATPLLVLFSPILVLAAFVIFLAFAEFVSSNGFILAVLAALGWINNYVAGKRSPEADKLDYADKARRVKEWARDYGVFRRVGH